MNKRARMRLIGVAAIIVIAIAAIVVSMGGKDISVQKDVSQVAKDPSLIGKRVRVTGSVVPGSWDKKANPMVFTIRSESDKNGTGPTVKIVYNGTTPSTFGDGVVAIVTGTLDKGLVVKSNDMITKCPSKYQAATGAMPVTSVLAQPAGIAVTVTGYVKPGSIGAAGATPRFVLAEKADGTGKAIPVDYAGGLPANVKDGTQLVIAGTKTADGTFKATAVAIESGAKQ